MSYEPKYKLNQRDEKRWRELVTREAANTNCVSRKFPPLSDKEKLELERLQRKRHRKIWSHPRMEPVKRAQRNNRRKLVRLFKKLCPVCKKAGIRIDKKL